MPPALCTIQVEGGAEFHAAFAAECARRGLRLGTCYNTIRPHQALCYRTPLQFPRVIRAPNPKVSPMYRTSTRP